MSYLDVLDTPGNVMRQVVLAKKILEVDDERMCCDAF